MTQVTRKNFGKALEGMQAALEAESKSKVKIFIKTQMYTKYL
jgi:hypothetical protein